MFARRKIGASTNAKYQNPPKNSCEDSTFPQNDALETKKRRFHRAGNLRFEFS